MACHSNVDVCDVEYGIDGSYILWKSPDGDVRRGRIVDVHGDLVLILWFSWLSGLPTYSTLESLSVMASGPVGKGPQFYDDMEEWESASAAAYSKATMEGR